MCCVPAPPVLVFDSEGNLLKSWGGPGHGYDWPSSQHGIFVDREDNMWFGGNGADDRQVLKFTNDGKFLKQLGRSFKGGPDSANTSLLGRPAVLEIDEAAHELYVSDGYLNKRVIVFDTDTLAFKRLWGGYGNEPNDADPVPTLTILTLSPINNFVHPSTALTSRSTASFTFATVPTTEFRYLRNKGDSSRNSSSDRKLESLGPFVTLLFHATRNRDTEQRYLDAAPKRRGRARHDRTRRSKCRSISLETLSGVGFRRESLYG